MASSKATTVTQVCDVSGLEGGVGFGKDSEATGAETAPPKSLGTGPSRRERLRVPGRFLSQTTG